MGSELKNMVTATDIKAGYDASAKRLLGNKNILAHILIKTVKEFKGMRPGEVADLERDFKNSKYNDIKRVYSIWVCMNMKENILSHVHLTKDDIIGEYEWKGKLDLFNIY